MRVSVDKLLLRFSVALIIVGLTAAYIRLPENTAQKIVASQQTQSAGIMPNIKQADMAINNSNSPDGSILQTPPKAHDYYTDLQEISNGFAPKTITFPKSGLNKLPASTSMLIQNVKANLGDNGLKDKYFQINTTLSNAHNLLDYNASVYKALSPLFDYNPAVDFANFSKDSQDTYDREQAAKAGLANVETNLKSQNGKYKKENLDDEIKVVGQLQPSLNNLINTGDVSQWAKDVQAAQTKILAERIVFWKTAKAAILDQLKMSQTDAADIQKAWTTL